MNIYLVAGEASGDRLGAALMAGLTKLNPEIRYFGVGGALMEARGLQSIFPMDDIAVMGLTEILPKYRQLKALINQTAEDVLNLKPDVLITIDSPEFAKRVARKVRAGMPDLHITHYVAPSVWAWRPGRAKKLKGLVDQVLALLPFEPPYLRAHGIRCDFVGHPIVAEPMPTPEEMDAFRSANSIGTEPILLVLPGSRANEVARLLPVFGQAVRRVFEDNPEIRVVVPAARGVVSSVREAVKDWPGNPIILDPNDFSPDDAEHQKRVAFGTADTAIAASGTVSLELAAAKTPCVIAYDLSWLSWQIMSRMVNLSSVTLVNLVAGRNAIPEFLGPECQAEPIADEVQRLLSDEGAVADQLEAMEICMKQLGEGEEAPGLRAARAVLDALSAR